MVLRQCLGVGPQFVGWNWLAGLAIKCALCSLANIPIERRDRLGIQLFSWPPALRFGPLLCIR